MAEMTDEQIATVVDSAERLATLLDKAEPFIEDLPALMQQVQRNPLLRSLFGG
jgi:hypothetical protein